MAGLIIVLGLIGTVSATETTLYVDDNDISTGIAAASENGLRAQEEGAMFQNWDIIPPSYNPEAIYNIYGTPGGSGEATRTRNEFSLPENAVEVSQGVFFILENQWLKVKS